MVGAAGWRCREYMGGEAIAPDGLVYLEHSPYGPGWHYLEYERSVRGRGRLERKMRGYASPRRMNDWPVLLVVWDKKAEAVFQQVGEQAGIPMLTSTVERIKNTERSEIHSAGPCMGRPWAWVDRSGVCGRHPVIPVCRRRRHPHPVSSSGAPLVEKGRSP